MSSYFEPAKLWLLRSARESSVVQGEATMESLHRFRMIALVVLAINLTYIMSFWQLGIAIDAAPTLNNKHAHAMIVTHAMMGICMVVLGWFAHRLCQQKKASYLAIIMQIFICACSLAFAIAITVVDQMLSNNTTPFVLISLLIAMLSLMRPALAIPLFVISYVVFFKATGITQTNMEILGRLQDNGRDVLIMCSVVSVIVWRQYVASVLLRREVARSHQALADKQIELAFLATHDPLTGLYNRREFMRLAEMELVRARRDPTPTHIIMLDIDHFKTINDRYGHPEGDLVLIKIAAVLASSMRETDVVARLGGEEFIILLPKTTREAALAVTEKLRIRINTTPHEAEGDAIAISASFGVTGISVGQAALLDDLYLAADQALYQAKEHGRNRVAFAEPNFVALPPSYVRRNTPS
jgi:diguanylate cyclase